MRLEEAIEILVRDNFGNVWPTPKAEIDAVRLGIEALKRVKVARISKALCPRGPLPGETEE